MAKLRKKGKKKAAGKHRTPGPDFWKYNYPILDHYSISGFLHSLTEKNYAEANKYLQVAIVNKTKHRIRAASDRI
jgi:hypothetical protein